MSKTLLILFFGLVMVALGEVCLSKGMKQVGRVDTAHIGELAAIFSRVVVNKTILLGVCFHFVYFMVWLVVLSRADLSLAQPLTAFVYVLCVFFSKYLLHEDVSTLRWVGTGLVVIGVMLLSRS